MHKHEISKPITIEVNIPVEIPIPKPNLKPLLFKNKLFESVSVVLFSLLLVEDCASINGILSIIVSAVFDLIQIETKNINYINLMI